MISAYMIDDVTIIRHGGLDSWNEPLATTDIDVKGKIDYRTRLVRNLAGEEVISPATVYFNDSIEAAAFLGRALTHEDRLRFDGIEHSILSIVRPKAFSWYHYEVAIA